MYFSSFGELIWFVVDGGEQMVVAKCISVNTLIWINGPGSILLLLETKNADGGC